MVIAFILFVFSLIIALAMLANYREHWYLPAFIAVICLTFLVSVSYVASDCEELGKFKTANNVYQCELIKTYRGNK